MLFNQPSQPVLKRILAAAGTGNILTAKVLLAQRSHISTLQDAEFKVFSQWGDDGIVQFLISKVDIPLKAFIEFGIADYTESLTRFLLINNNWHGLIMDSSKENVHYIKNDEIYWRHDITAKHAFITAQNIDNLIGESDFNGEIGLLHIDIDGNEYWVWKAITVVRPVIVAIEYNSLFGPTRAITVPYRANFERHKAHYSGLYAGASLSALCDLGEGKGYDFVGSNSAGNNAYFVRKDKINGLKKLTPSEGYVKALFRESRDKRGRLTFFNHEHSFTLIKDLEVFNTRENLPEKI